MSYGMNSLITRFVYNICTGDELTECAKRPPYIGVVDGEERMFCCEDGYIKQAVMMDQYKIQLEVDREIILDIMKKIDNDKS